MVDYGGLGSKAHCVRAHVVILSSATGEEVIMMVEVFETVRSPPRLNWPVSATRDRAKFNFSAQGTEANDEKRHTIAVREPPNRQSRQEVWLYDVVPVLLTGPAIP